MIKIYIDQNRLDAIAEEHWAHLKNSPFDIINKALAAQSKLKLHKNENEILLYLIKNLERIIKGNPDELNDVLIEFYEKYDKKLFTKSKKDFALKLIDDDNYSLNKFQHLHYFKTIIKIKYRKKFKELLEGIFDYTKFVNRYTNWGAYSLAKKLNINVCPYCNRIWTFTIKCDDGKTRPEFDHFFDKATFPFLALSFYNLIPSCHICNSNLKGTESFDLATNISPYKEGYENSYKFRIKPLAQNGNYLDNLDSFEIEIKEVEKKDNRVDNNLQTFLIEKIYNEHKDIALELAIKGQSYPESWLDELFAKGKFSSKAEIVDNLVGNYICNEKDFCKRPLAKFTRDIIENETDLLDYLK